MNYHIVPVTDFEQNCSLLWCEHSLKAAIVDPGGDISLILDAVQQLGITPVLILLTHGHIDHVGGAGELAQHLNVPIEGPNSGDRPWLESMDKQSEKFGLPNAKSFVPDRWLIHNDRVRFGDEVLEVLHCPGHTPGHVVFFNRKDKLALVGDVLFQGSIGRTDLPFGDHATLLRSIREQLWPLGDEVRFIPGHGFLSSFGAERRNNPYVGECSIM